MIKYILQDKDIINSSLLTR
uniref:Uncharacterized protein n=1 Tax=Rhizophora mucronata TaxID=61149 RepID=A0A2P2PA10_RHIMU